MTARAGTRVLLEVEVTLDGSGVAGVEDVSSQLERDVARQKGVAGAHVAMAHVERARPLAPSSGKMLVVRPKGRAESDGGADGPEGDDDDNERSARTFLRRRGFQGDER